MKFIKTIEPEFPGKFYYHTLRGAQGIKTHEGTPWQGVS